MGRRTSIRRQSTREERAEVFSRDKNEGTKRRGEGGEESLLCDLRSELRPGRKEKREAKITSGKKKGKNTRFGGQTA